LFYDIIEIIGDAKELIALLFEEKNSSKGKQNGATS
jgi:hypothetical protein